jgi:hypothetical protein
MTNTGSAVEVFSASAFAFDLRLAHQRAGLRVPGGGVLARRQALAWRKTAQPTPLPTARTRHLLRDFDGNLDADGETTLLKPGVSSAPDLVIDKVRYEARLPWAANANGGGASLQLIDPAQDNSRPSNWTDRQGWQQVIYTGTIQGGASPGTNFAIFTSGSAGDFYIDDIVLVTGTVANVGANLVLNGDFESPLSGPWSAQGNHSSSVISVDTVHRERLTARHRHRFGRTDRGGAPDDPRIRVEHRGTVSYWFRPGTNRVQGQVRTFGGSLFSSVVSIRPANHARHDQQRPALAARLRSALAQ